MTRTGCSRRAGTVGAGPGPAGRPSPGVEVKTDDGATWTDADARRGPRPVGLAAFTVAWEATARRAPAARGAPPRRRVQPVDPAWNRRPAAPLVVADPDEPRRRPARGRKLSGQPVAQRAVHVGVVEQAEVVGPRHVQRLGAEQLGAVRPGRTPTVRTSRSPRKAPTGCRGAGERRGDEPVARVRQRRYVSASPATRSWTPTERQSRIRPKAAVSGQPGRRPCCRDRCTPPSGRRRAGYRARPRR